MFSLNLSGSAPSRRGHKRVDTCGFHPLVNHPFPLRVWRRLPTCDRCEIGERQSGYLSVSFSAFSQFTDSVLLHIRLNLRRRGITVPRNSLTRYTARHLRIRRLVQFIFAGPVSNNALKNCAALLCRALRRVAHLCSRKVSDTANMRIHKRTQCVSAEEKLLCRSPASQRSHVSNLRQTLKGKGRFTRGWKPQVSTLLCARAASAQFRSPRRRKTIVYQKII